MDKRLTIRRGEERLPGSGKGGMLQPASAGKVSMLVAASIPPVITSPAIENMNKFKQQIYILLVFF